MSNYDGGPMLRAPAEQPSGTQREKELANDYKTAQRSDKKMAGLFGSKKDTRPIDVGLASLIGSD